MKTLLYSLAIASVIGLTASCSGGKTQQADNAPAPASAVAQQDAVELLGDWDILQVNQTPVEQTDDTPYLSFNLGEHTIAGMTGCNRLMGTIVTGDAANQISFKDVAITRMACPDDALETQILAALNDVRSYGELPVPQGEDPQIALYGVDQTQLFVLRREPLSDTVLQTTPEEN